jgi:hypothetical protein
MIKGPRLELARGLTDLAVSLTTDLACEVDKPAANATFPRCRSPVMTLIRVF